MALSSLDHTFGSAFMVQTGSSSSNNATVLSIREEDLRLLSDTIDQTLNSADKTLKGLEADRDLLPDSIIRLCQEFANCLGSMAGELEGQSEQERRILVEAIQEDLRLFDEDCGYGAQRHITGVPMSTTCDGDNVTDEDNTEDMLGALSGASTLLRDVENAFREIGKDEAEEIADSALIMARLFLLSMQNFQSNFKKKFLSSNADPNNFKCKKSSQVGRDSDQDERSAVWIEELSSDDGIQTNRLIENRQVGDERLNATDQTHGSSDQQRRMRVLWPPLGPKVDAAMTWTREESIKRPLLSIALGLTMWPVVISTALLGVSVSLIDGAFQNTYERFRQTPWILIAEESFAQAHHVGRFTLATGKVVGKQSLRVVKRQIERRGGLQPIVQDLGGMALDRISHPIDTIGGLWDGVCWSFGVVKSVTGDILSIRQESHDPLM